MNIFVLVTAIFIKFLSFSFATSNEENSVFQVGGRDIFAPTQVIYMHFTFDAETLSFKDNDANNERGFWQRTNRLPDKLSTYHMQERKVIEDEFVKSQQVLDEIDPNSKLHKSQSNIVKSLQIRKKELERDQAIVSKIPTTISHFFYFMMLYSAYRKKTEPFKQFLEELENKDYCGRKLGELFFNMNTYYHLFLKINPRLNRRVLGGEIKEILVYLHQNSEKLNNRRTELRKLKKEKGNLNGKNCEYKNLAQFDRDIHNLEQKIKNLIKEIDYGIQPLNGYFITLLKQIRNFAEELSNDIELTQEVIPVKSSITISADNPDCPLFLVGLP